MGEDFEKWNKVKQDTHKSDKKPVYFHEREIWWCRLGMNIGHEENGKNQYFERPVLILRKITRRLAFIIPLTSSDTGISFCIPIGKISGKDAKAILSQARTIDAKRLFRKVETLDESIFIKIKTATKEFLFIGDNFL